MSEILLDRTKNSLAAFIRSVVGLAIVGNRVDFLAFYPCNVASQNSDKTLEMTPDDARLGPGFSRVPLRLGLPGTVVTLSTPTRCLIGWYGGDPQKPFAALFEQSSVTEIDFSATTIKLNGGSNGVARNGDSIQISIAQFAAAGPANGGGPVTITAPMQGTVNAGSTSVKCG